MVCVEKWKEHFQRQAHLTFPKEEMYIVNQMRCGLGRNAYSRHAMYKVQCTSGSNPSVEIVSPIACSKQSQVHARRKRWKDKVQKQRTYKKKEQVP